ncbi:Holliday junction resolvase RuvX [Xylocopilactobacillus apicola]|uniref:Putative pre-16S rRNA nuclease n=1 Tax=Xylocopilactobacillus apicola TaxID=2932184 RepID=A0AAU9D8U1_9LACO|nr:Holliday junction resolvase RuvX [Xylocopilactobacillus apicola]BDR58811.1 putative pre-16S rRNA nuclease [Xylocopilactobacillus apicola]
MKRYIGLDLGTKTLGVAYSDLMGITAQSLEIIPIDTANNNFGLKRLRAIVEEYKADEFVLGYPKNMNNTIGARAKATEDFKVLLQQKFAMPVHLIDERLTTVAASRILVEKADVSRKKQKKAIDKLAASFILQTYLDRKSF